MALTEVGTKGITNASIKLEDIENGTTSDAGKFLKNVDGGSPVWDNIDLSTFNSAVTFNEDVTFESNSTNSRIVFDKSADSLSFNTWTYLNFRVTDDTDVGTASIYGVGSELRIASGLTHFWGSSGLQGTMVISGFSFDWLNIGTNASADNQTKLYNGQNSLKWQTKTWGAEYVGSGAVRLPNGTTAQRPTAFLGQLRYNTDTNAFEGYQGSTAAWGSIGGGATGGGSDAIFWENGQTITTDYTIGDGFGAVCNAMTAGPVTINTGVTVTVESGETWTVL